MYVTVCVWRQRDTYRGERDKEEEMSFGDQFLK